MYISKIINLSYKINIYYIIILSLNHIISYQINDIIKKILCKKQNMPKVLNNYFKFI